jgi:hypothetical protein
MASKNGRDIRGNSVQLDLCIHHHTHAGAWPSTGWWTSSKSSVTKCLVFFWVSRPWPFGCCSGALVHFPVFLRRKQSFHNRARIDPEEQITCWLVFIHLIYVWLSCNETGVLDPRPKLLEFHMLGLVTHPYTPNKEARWRARKDLLHGSDMPWEEAE